MKLFYTLFLSLVVAFSAQAQQDMIRCYTVENEAAMREAGLTVETDLQFEVWMARKLAERRQQRSPETVNYTIPVVFHVLYRSATENISLEQIMSQMEVLNEDFGRYNPDTNNTPVGFRPVAANTGIQFCLARQDPAGNPTNGVVRYSYASGTSFSTNFINNTVKPATQWNPDHYLNIWVAPMSGGILGYAQFPTGSGLPGLGGSGSGNTDGVVLLHTSVGRPPANPFSGIYNGGRTATHEVGHYLGLRHIWGDGGCGVDDYCADTPESDAANFNCPTTHVSCSTVDMVQNYMDYTQDNCMNIFTLNQTERMWVVMDNSPRRMSLIASPGCQQAVQRPVAGFIYSADTVCVGGSMSFSDTSTNLPLSWKWYFPGATPDSSGSQSPSGIVYGAPGDYSVTLIVTNNAGSDTLVRTNLVRVVTGIQAQLNQLPAVCLNDSIFELTQGLPRGGIYSGPGISAARFFNPATAGAGQHIIQYQAAGCGLSDTAVITVLGVPSVQFQVTDTVCLAAAGITLTALPAGGTFSGTGVSNGQFNPTAAGVGLVEVYYTYQQAGCAVTDTERVRVLAPPVIGFSGQENHCISAGTITLGATPAGGVFSGPGVTANGQMDLTTAGVGLHTVTYTYTDGFGCSNSGTRTVIVTARPTISFNPIGSVCVTANNIVLNLASPAGGSYSGNGVQFGIFNPAHAGVGSHRIYYTTGVSGCTSTDSITLVVTAAPMAEIETVGDSLQSRFVAGGYQWYKDGTVISGAVNRTFTPLENGLYTLVVDSGGCFSLPSGAVSFFMTSTNMLLMQHISVFPNPSESGRFELRRVPLPGKLSLSVRDVRGRLLQEQVVEGASTEIHLETQPAGIYLLQLIHEQQTVVIRLIRK